MIDALFGSKTRVKLLHLFLNNPDRAFYVREITRKIDEQINSVRRELANMLNVGIIKSDSSNNRLYYEVNQEYPHYKPLRAIFSDDNLDSDVVSATEANDWAKRLRTIGDVKVALVAGKLVQGSGAEVDMLFAGDINKAQMKRLIKEIEEEEGKVLNYTSMSYEDFYYRLSIKDRFITPIINGKFSVLLDSENILSK